MKTLLRVVLVVSLFIIEPNKFLRANPVVLPQYGFQIDPLDSPAGNTTSEAIALFLPVTNGFAPNVNVQIQPYGDDIKSYAELSKKQFDQFSFTMVAESYPNDHEWVIEYTGNLHGASLHWYARAVLSSGKVYLVTATAKDVGWADVSAALKQSVDSFKLK